MNSAPSPQILKEETLFSVEGLDLTGNWRTIETWDNPTTGPANRINPTPKQKVAEQFHREISQEIQEGKWPGWKAARLVQNKTIKTLLKDISSPT
jgi:hypothetical protein